MRPVFRATTPEDLPRLRELLGSVLPSGHNTPMRRPEQMHWAYWLERPDWTGSRSYVIERDGVLLAHGAAWPAHLDNGGHGRGFNLFDWAARPESPGMGTAVFRKMAELVDFVWISGGSDEANRMREANGFREVHPIYFYAIPLRPLKMALSTPRRDWKTPARFVRNELWKRGAARPEAGWEAVGLPDPRVAAKRWGRGGSFQRSFELADYYARCPVARVEWFDVRRQGESKGCFCMVFVPGQARLAEAAADGAAAWKNLAALAIRTARSERDCHELTACASPGEFCEGLTAAGLQRRDREELMVFDPRQRLGERPLDFQFLQGDAAIWHTSRPQYRC